MKTLIVGVSARSMAESAVRSDYAVVALDAFGDLDLQRLCECYSLRRDFDLPYSARDLFKASQQLQFEAVVYTSNLENYPELVRRFSRRCPVLGNPAEVVKRVRHWPTLFATLSQAGFRSPETMYSINGKRPAPDRSWLRKPLRSGGGQHVDFWQEAEPLGRGFLLQEYLEGRVCSAAFVANKHEAVVIGLSEQLIGRPEFGGQKFHYCGNLLPLDASVDAAAVLDQTRRIADLLTREFGLVGVNGVDFILVNGEVWLIEVNPRYSASMELIERAYGLPVFDLHVQAVTQGDLPSFDLAQTARSAGGYTSKAILFAEDNRRAPDTQSWPERGRRDVPHPGESLAAGKPICTILAGGVSRDDCFKNLVAEAESLKGEIYG
jgi:predicted ATP-grasp superfamily ATP-dependent carboligase